MTAWNASRSCSSLCLALCLVLPLAMAGCGPGGDTPADLPLLDLGTAVEVTKTTIGAEGGTINVADAGGTIDGITIEVPEGALAEPTTFTLSYRPIESHTLGGNFNPVTPVITVDSGDVRAEVPILVTVPVQIAADEHVMAFIYDEENGRLEALPEIDHDATSFTFATRHFCDILLNKVFWQLLLNDFDSGFRVQHDNWQFNNFTTYLSPGGMCSGMSATALYYYLERKVKGKKPKLFLEYDNDGDKQNPTPLFDKDDSNAIHIAATAQWYRTNYQSEELNYWYKVAENKNDMWTFLMFAHALMLTGEPQYVAIYPENDHRGHALIVYRKVGDTLYVADPNEPSTENKIQYEFDAEGELHFKPYESRWNAGTDKIEYTKVIYVGHRYVVQWDELAELWQKMDAGTVGEDFPQYHFVVLEENPDGSTKQVLLQDGYTTTESAITLKLVIDSHKWFTPRLTSYDRHQSQLSQVEGETIDVALSDGENRFGILAEAEEDSDVTGQKEWVWTGFDWFTVRRGTDRVTATITSPANGSTHSADDSITFRGSGQDADGNAIIGGSLVWTSDRDGDLGTGETVTVSLSENTHQITLTTTDAAGQEAIDHITIFVGAGAEAAISVFYRDDCLDDDYLMIHEEPPVVIGTTEQFVLTIKNLGGAPLQITVPLEINEDDQEKFAVTRQPDATVAPGGSTTFEVAFTPQSIGYGKTSIHIENNGLGGYLYSVHLNIVAEHPWTYYAFIDQETGLMWQYKSRQASTGSISTTWHDAADYCEDLEIADYDNWRMPTRDELVDMLGGYTGESDQYAHSCRDVEKCLQFYVSGYDEWWGADKGRYWSSTPHDEPGDYWVANFENGVIMHYSADSTGPNVHCVREGGE